MKEMSPLLVSKTKQGPPLVRTTAMSGPAVGLPRMDRPFYY